MSKITKKDLQLQINRLYAADSTRHNKMLRMQRALSSLGVDIMSDDFDKPSEPKLKVLDQSVFDGLDEKWRFAAVDEDSRAFKFDCEPAINCDEWYEGHGQKKVLIGTGYDASSWQNSLIERESKKLTGSDLCRAMLLKLDENVMCDVGDGDYELILVHDGLHFITADGVPYMDATPIRTNGEPLTAKEVGL